MKLIKLLCLTASICRVKSTFNSIPSRSSEKNLHSKISIEKKDTFTMVALGRGSRSVDFRYHFLRLQKVRIEREKLSIAILLSFTEDEKEVIRRPPLRSRYRATAGSIFDDLGEMCRRSFRMTYETFCALYRKLASPLKEVFTPDGVAYA